MENLREKNARQRILTHEIAAQKEVYDRLIKFLDSGSLRENLLVARVHLLANEQQMEQALEESVRAIDLLSHVPNQPRRGLDGPQSIFAEILRWEGLFDKVAKERPREPGLWMARCGRSIFKHQWDDAARDWLKVAELIQDEEPNQLGRLVLETTAIMNEELLRRVADRYPQKESLWWARARHLLSEKKWDEADAALDKVIALTKDPQSYWMVRGRTLLERGEIQKADMIYAKIIDDKPGDVATLLRIAEEFVQFKRVNEAAALLAKGVAAAPKDVAVRLTQARFLAEQKRWQRGGARLQRRPRSTSSGRGRRAVVARRPLSRVDCTRAEPVPSGRRDAAQERSTALVDPGARFRKPKALDQCVACLSEGRRSRSEELQGLG